MTELVLDASALISMLRKEPGGEAVAHVLAGARMSVVNFAEVVSHFTHAGVPQAELREIFATIGLSLVDADAELAWSAGRLRRTTAEAGLSLGDRFCLALGARDRLPVWTADRQWRTIADKLDVEIVLIR
ncbi:MAG: type II toxin-antitoxin system VapC family toxin [Roseiarcus sp.]